MSGNLWMFSDMLDDEDTGRIRMYLMKMSSRSC